MVQVAGRSAISDKKRALQARRSEAKPKTAKPKSPSSIRRADRPTPTAADKNDRFERRATPTSAPSAATTAPPIPDQPVDPVDVQEPSTLTSERRAEIDEWDQRLDDEDHEAHLDVNAEVDTVETALLGDSELGDLTDDEQSYLLETVTDRWSDADALHYDRLTNYAAIDQLAYRASETPEISEAVSTAYARQAVEMQNDGLSADVFLSSNRALASTFAAQSVHAAGTPENRRDLIERLGPEDATTLTAAISNDFLAPFSPLGIPENSGTRAFRATQLIDATQLGEPTEASHAVVSTAFATASPDMLQADDNGLARSLGTSLALHWHPDDPSLAASEGERLSEVFSTNQGREYLFDQRLPLETRLDNLARVQANEDWDRDVFTDRGSIYDNPAIVFETALPTAVQYRDLRGDDPTQLSGSDLENTVGFAMGFPPQGVDPNETEAQRDAREAAIASGDHSLFEGEPAEDIVGPVAASIRNIGGDDPEVTVLPIQYAAAGAGTVDLPLFRVVDEETGAERFVDNTGRTYDNFNDWQDNNQLPPGNMVYPEDGHLGSPVRVRSANTPQTVDSFGEHVTSVLDTASLVGGVIAGGAIILGSGGVLAPAVVGGAAAWQTYRGLDALEDRRQHGQSINPFDDPGARGAWLNVGAGAASVLSLGATGVAGRLAANGSRLAAPGAAAASFLRVGANVLDAGAAADAGYTLVTNWDELSGGERASLALSVGFWGVTAAAGSRLGGDRIRPFDLEAQRQSTLYGDLDGSTHRVLQDELGDDLGALVARSDAFLDLTPSARRTYIRNNAEEFRALEASNGFADLPPTARRDLVERWPDVDANARQVFLDSPLTAPRDRAAVAQLMTADGFTNLSGPEQTQLLNLVSGDNPHVSQAVRDGISARLSQGASGEGTSAAVLRSFIDDPPGLRPVTAGFENHAQATDGYAVHPPETLGRFQFRNGPAPAERYVIDVDGQSVEVVVSTGDAPDGEYLPSVTDIADSLSRLPPEALREIDTVVIENRPNPDDAFWAEQYGTDDFSSYMTADVYNNTINVYPSGHQPNRNNIASSLSHEVGHFQSGTRWGVDHVNGEAWEPWRDAIAGDTGAVSEYANNNANEDFSETYAVYLDVIGTPYEAELRTLMPQRFAILDEIHGGS